MAEPIPTIRVKHPSLNREQFLERYAGRVASSGIQMPTANQRPVGSRVRLILELKSGESVVGEAVVESHVRIRETPGISLRYVRLHEGGIVFPLSSPPPSPALADPARPSPPRPADRPAPTPVSRAVAPRAGTPESQPAAPAGRPGLAPPPPAALRQPPPRAPQRPAPTPARGAAAPTAAPPPAPPPPDLDSSDPFPGFDAAFAPHDAEPSGSPPPARAGIPDEPPPPPPRLALDLEEPPPSATPTATDAAARARLTLEDLQLDTAPEEPTAAGAPPAVAAEPVAAKLPTLAAAPEPEPEPLGDTAPGAKARARSRRRMILAAASLVALLGAAGAGFLVQQRRAKAAARASVTTAAPVTARCERASGTVEVRHKGDPTWRPLAAGGALRDGDVVRTGPSSSGRLAFTGGGALELEERASVEIGTHATPAKGGPGVSAERVVAVQEGVVRGVLPSASDSQPLGLVVRGEDGSTTRLATAKGSVPAEFRLTRAPKGTEVAVTGGEVDVGIGAGGQKLGAGRAIDLPPDARARPAALLDFPASLAPGVDARFPWKKGLEVRLAWKKVPNATGYRVQVARALSFETVSRTLEADGTEVSFRPEADGMYTWRVASRDAGGRYGEYGFARRLYCERSSAPLDLLVGPADREVVTASGAAATVAFTWQSAADAPSYRLVLAGTPALRGRTAVTRTTKDQRVELKGIAPGTYYWGVYAGEGDAAKPIFQKPRSLVVRRAGKTGAR